VNTFELVILMAKYLCVFFVRFLPGLLHTETQSKIRRLSNIPALLRPPRQLPGRAHRQLNLNTSPSALRHETRDHHVDLEPPLSALNSCCSDEGVKRREREREREMEMEEGSEMLTGSTCLPCRVSRLQQGPHFFQEATFKHAACVSV